METYEVLGAMLQALRALLISFTKKKWVF